MNRRDFIYVDWDKHIVSPILKTKRGKIRALFLSIKVFAIIEEDAKKIFENSKDEIEKNNIFHSLEYFAGKFIWNHSQYYNTSPFSDDYNPTKEAIKKYGPFGKSTMTITKLKELEVAIRKIIKEEEKKQKKRKNLKKEI